MHLRIRATAFFALAILCRISTAQIFDSPVTDHWIKAATPTLLLSDETPDALFLEADLKRPQGPPFEVDMMLAKRGANSHQKIIAVRKLLCRTISSAEIEYLGKQLGMTFLITIDFIKERLFPPSAWTVCTANQESDLAKVFPDFLMFNSDSTTRRNIAGPVTRYEEPSPKNGLNERRVRHAIAAFPQGTLLIAFP
jgi:hypothetical protein